MSTGNNKELSSTQSDELITILKTRFEKNQHRHKEIQWEAVIEKLSKNQEKLWSLNEMELSGGEPDVIDFDKETGEYIFVDCAAESPKGRRSTAYDHEGQYSRKEHIPENNAIDMATEMGVEVLSEEDYRKLQSLGDFDLKTSSWLKTPENIRALGGAIFGDKRYNNVFIYHNGAQSYYAARAFRGILRV
ncbi:MAG: DUF4256 domain-containing protein [Pedobacter sp.]|nr:MAG: DUF4256 domain-containing protein [Pedobacter sp.]